MKKLQGKVTQIYKNPNNKHLSQNLKDYAFRLSIEKLLTERDPPEYVVERIIHYCDLYGSWKLKIMILNRLSDMDLDESNIWSTLKFGLENGHDETITHCLYFLKKNYDLTIFNHDRFMRLNIYLSPNETSLYENHCKYLAPLFDNFERIAGIPAREHTISLDVTSDTDPAYLKSFLKTYRENFQKICFFLFDHLDDQFICDHFDNIPQLKELEIFMGKSFNENSVQCLNRLASLESIVIDHDGIELLSFYDFKSLRWLKLKNLRRANSIILRDNPKLRMVHICECPELRTLEILGNRDLEEIQISNCCKCEQLVLRSSLNLKKLRIVKCPNLKQVSSDNIE